MEESEFLREWQDKARIVTLRENLMRVLAKKFAGPLPVQILSAVQSQTDLAELSRWFDAALDAASLGEFQAALQVASTP